jgi:hypothetical protein
MYSALVLSLLLLSIGILMAHAMEGLFWLGDRQPVAIKKTSSRIGIRSADGPSAG